MFPRNEVVRLVIGRALFPRLTWRMTPTIVAPSLSNEKLQGALSCGRGKVKVPLLLAGVTPLTSTLLGHGSFKA